MSFVYAVLGGGRQGHGRHVAGLRPQLGRARAVGGADRAGAGDEAWQASRFEAVERYILETLDEEERAIIARVQRAYEGLSPIPCTKCGYCMPCPNGVNIPRNFALMNLQEVRFTPLGPQDLASVLGHLHPGRAGHMFQGITDATMSHGEGWHFARLGRLLERADKTSRILDVKYFMLLPTVAEVGTPFDIIQWSALLKSASAFSFWPPVR